MASCTDIFTAPSDMELGKMERKTVKEVAIPPLALENRWWIRWLLPRSHQWSWWRETGMMNSSPPWPAAADIFSILPLAMAVREAEMNLTKGMKRKIKKGLVTPPLHCWQRSRDGS